MRKWQFEGSMGKKFPRLHLNRKKLSLVVPVIPAMSGGIK
jgi:hypothetical protein